MDELDRKWKEQLRYERSSEYRLKMATKEVLNVTYSSAHCTCKCVRVDFPKGGLATYYTILQFEDNVIGRVIRTKLVLDAKGLYKFYTDLLLEEYRKAELVRSLHFNLNKKL